MEQHRGGFKVKLRGAAARDRQGHRAGQAGGRPVETSNLLMLQQSVEVSERFGRRREPAWRIIAASFKVTHSAQRA